jgi:lipopolysaccharide export LptBFGC system permease protein LptF
MKLRIFLPLVTRPRLLRIAFGVYSSYLFRQHLRHSSIVAAALLSLALTIDLIPQLPLLLIASGGGASVHDVSSLLIFRGADLLPRFLPLSVFLGVLWTEVALTSSRERLLIWNSARAPWHFLAPVTGIAVVFGFAQFELDNSGRPAAMSAQIQSHLGSLGQMYDRRPSTQSTWFSAGSDLVRARVQYAPVILHDVTLYRFDETWRLTEIDTAQTAVPDKNRNAWRLLEGETWAFGSKPGAAPTEAHDAPKLRDPFTYKFSERKLVVALDPVWVGVWGIGPEYLSRSALTAITSVNHDAPTNALFRTRIELNWANATMPGAMALLASVLAVFLLPYRVQFIRAFGAGLVGYAAHLAMRIAVLFGEHGILSPAFAAWLVPFSIYVCAGVLLGVFIFRRKVEIADLHNLEVTVRKTANQAAKPGREPILTNSLAAAP